MHRLNLCRFVFWLLAGAFLPGATTVAADAPSIDDQTVIDEIVVVAQKRAQPVTDIAANVTILSQADMAATLATDIGDVFRYTPGIDYETSGTRFGGESLNIRGIAGNRVAMMIDGVMLGDQFDVGRFANATRDFLSAGLIERVEVLHGPASALYGSSAIGGVVAAATPSAQNYLGSTPVGGKLRSTWQDANDKLSTVALLAAGDRDLNVLLGASFGTGHQTDSSAAADSLDKRTSDQHAFIGKFKLGDRFGNDWETGIIYQESEVDSGLTSMLGTGRFRSTTALLGHDESAMLLTHIGVRFSELGPFADSVHLRGFYQKGEIRQDTYDERGNASRPVAIDRYFAFEQDNVGAEFVLEKDFLTGSTEHQLTYGAEFSISNVEEFRDGRETGIEDGLTTNILLGEVFPIRDFPLSETREWAVFLEDVVVIGDWRIIASARADSYALNPQPDALYDEDYPFATPVSIDESHWSPKLGLIRHIGESAELYFQYAHGFRAPPYEDANIGLEIPLFGYRAIPNPDLQSEQSDTVELGFRWRSEANEIRLGLFTTEYQDFIESRVRLGIDPDSGLTLFQSQNINRTNIRGIEGGWSMRLPGLAQQLTFDGAFYYANGKNEVIGEALNSVGPGQATAGLAWASPDERRGWRVQGTFTDGWSDRDESGGELFKPPGYAVFDLFLSQSLGERTTARIGVLNLTDKTYWYWSDVRGLSPDDPIIPYIARAGRSLSLSLDISWQ